MSDISTWDYSNLHSIKLLQQVTTIQRGHKLCSYIRHILKTWYNTGIFGKTLLQHQSFNSIQQWPFTCRGDMNEEDWESHFGRISKKNFRSMIIIHYLIILIGQTGKTNKYLVSEAGTLFKGRNPVFCTFTSATFYIVHSIAVLYFVGAHQQFEPGYKIRFCNVLIFQLEKLPSVTFP
jgi:hypothetical protein